MVKPLNLKRPVLVWTLLVCIVLMNAMMAAPSVSHAEHHSDHHTGTHSTGICAWLCAAGQGIESSTVELTSSLQLIEPVVVYPFTRVFSLVLFDFFLRGPPPSLR